MLVTAAVWLMLARDKRYVFEMLGASCWSRLRQPSFVPRP